MRKATVIAFIICVALCSSCSLGPAQTTEGPLPTDTRQPASTARPVPTDTASPSNTPEPSETPRPTDTAEPTDTPVPTATATPRPTDTPEPTSTPTPVPTFALSGVVFFDYNGNGVHDGHEPPIEGATVQAGSLSVASASDGTYKLRGVPQGHRRISVSAAGFRYLSLSPAAFQSLQSAVSVTIAGDTQRDWGLMQGFLTLPFASGTAFSRSSAFGLASVFDLDPAVGSARAYDPGIPPTWQASSPPWVMDNHIGLDFCFAEGNPIRAAMPGVVTYVGEDEYGGLGLWLCCGRWANYYNHNSEILVGVGDEVQRGQVIALSGNTGQSGEPHLHFSLTTCTTPPEWIDPYRDLSKPGSVSYWTVDNAPQYP